MTSPNEIEETEKFFVLWKNAHLPAVGIVPFKDIYIEWAQDGTRVKIRRLVYPKAEYDRAAVERIARATAECPFCREGKQVMDLTLEGILPYTSRHALPDPLQAWNDFWKNLSAKWNRFFGLPVQGESRRGNL